MVSDNFILIGKINRLEQTEKHIDLFRSSLFHCLFQVAEMNKYQFL